MTYAYQRRLMDLVPQRWYNVVYHVHSSASAENSVVDAWVDGNQVIAGFHPPGGTVYAATPTDDRVGTYRKQGFYHSASIPAARSTWPDSATAPPTRPSTRARSP